jgi:hypothetical protein
MPLQSRSTTREAYMYATFEDIDELGDWNREVMAILLEINSLSEMIEEIDRGFCDLRIRRRAGEVEPVQNYINPTEMMETFKMHLHQGLEVCYAALREKGVFIKKTDLKDIGVPKKQ